MHGNARYQIEQEIKTKERAIEKLARSYCTPALNAFVASHNGFLMNSDRIRTCIYSITDNHSYLRTNRQPIDDMLALLERCFNPDSFEEGYRYSTFVLISGTTCRSTPAWTERG